MPISEKADRKFFAQGNNDEKYWGRRMKKQCGGEAVKGYETAEGDRDYRET